MKIMKIVEAIKAGKWRYKAEQDAEAKEKRKILALYAIWNDDDEKRIDSKYKPLPIPAPKMPPPGHAASYNPPMEYLFTPEEEKAWLETDPSQRPLDFIPKKYSSLRAVPLYSNGIRERFERCLDLYLCPRVTKDRMHITDINELLPTLPDLSELKPFPTHEMLLFRGHVSRVRSISVDGSGQYVASGSDDKTVKLWELTTGRCLSTWTFPSEVKFVAWCPSASVQLLAVVHGKTLALLYPGTCTPANAESTWIVLNNIKDELVSKQSSSNKDSDSSNGDSDSEGDSDDDQAQGGKAGTSPVVGVWKLSEAWTEGSVSSPSSLLKPLRNPPKKADVLAWQALTGVQVSIEHVHFIRQAAWHRKGDYISTVAPESTLADSVVVHQLSKASSLAPFQKSKGLVQQVAFHPFKPYFYLANQQSIRVYNLLKMNGNDPSDPTNGLISKLESGVKWISCFDIHPSGDHVILGSYDHKVVWFDTQLSVKPFKSLSYHQSGVRQVAFHHGINTSSSTTVSAYPLMATASDDGSVHVFHAKTYNDFINNPLIVPVKILRGHQVQEKDGLGVLDIKWHPSQPWILSAGADTTIRMWHDVV
jgi:ribosome biogenesis protein ERB1